MNEDFVSFDLAKKLKEKGYPQAEKNALAMYDEDGDWCSLSPTLDDYYYDFEGFDRHDFVCPTISQVLKWLRENRFVLVINPACFNADSICTGWQCDIWADDNYEPLHKEYKTYEQAALAGIEYVLDNLI